MYIYNITYNIEKSIEDQWLLWIEQDYLKSLKQEGFDSIKFLKIEISDELSSSYCLQLFSNQRHVIENFCNQEIKYKTMMYKHFGQRAVSFSTGLKELKTYL